MPVWITTNFQIKGLKRGQLILMQPYRKSVFLGDCGSPGLQEFKGGLFFSKDSQLILHGFTVIAQGSVVRMDDASVIELGNNFYCNKNCFFRSSINIFFGKDCLLGWNVQINTSDGHVIYHDNKETVADKPISFGNHVWLTSNTIIAKGVSIADGTIVAQGAVVTRNIDETNCLVGGESKNNSKECFMEGMIKVSVIIPIYNTGEKLYRCLDSVREQSFKNFECLMIDDGSKDNSPEIIDQYSLQDKRFKAIHKLNGGVSSARNLGLQNAKGEWVVFLDSDDLMMPNHLEAMLSVVMDNTDIVFTGFDQISTDDSIIMGHQYHSEHYYGVQEIVSFLSETDALQFMIPWDRMYRRSIIEREAIRFDEHLSLSEDRLFCYHFLLHTLGIATISGVTYRHDASDVSTLSFRFYPFQVNAYRHDVFVDAIGKLLARFPFPNHTIYMLWKYVWDILVLSLSSMYDVKKNIFIVANKQKLFFEQHFSRILYDMVHNTPEVISFAQTKDFQIIYNEHFLKWNFRKAINFILYKLHISR